jgi:hypothetical protein
MVRLPTHLPWCDRVDRPRGHGEYPHGSRQREMSQERSLTPASRCLSPHTHLLLTDETLSVKYPSTFFTDVDRS